MPKIDFASKEQRRARARKNKRQDAAFRRLGSFYNSEPIRSVRVSRPDRSNVGLFPESAFEPALYAWFDRACAPVNPGGHGGFGALIMRGDEVLLREAGYVGVGPSISNNVAECCGVIRILEALQSINEPCLIYGDSEIIINKLNRREYRKAKGLYAPYYDQAFKLTANIWDRVKFQWIPREQNELCDYLSTLALEDHLQTDDINFNQALRHDAT